MVPSQYHPSTMPPPYQYRGGVGCPGNSQAGGNRVVLEEAIWIDGPPSLFLAVDNSRSPAVIWVHESLAH